jgi:uncharacterized protein YndB with AHSA1/START domain
MKADRTADREIVVTRVLDAPRDLVFAAWTKQEHVEKWWGPGGVTTLEWNAKPGGLWRYSQPGPDGAQYLFKIKFVEIAKPARLVYDFGTDAENAPEPVRTHVTFEEENGKTKITLQLVFATAAAYTEAAKYGAVGGAKAALESVANYVAKL